MISLASRRVHNKLWFHLTRTAHPSRPSCPFSSSACTMRPLTAADLNPSVANVQYAVRGELAIKAEKYREKHKEPDHGLPFSKVISSNIGNPQQKGLDQPPITFIRQVSAACSLFPTSPTFHIPISTCCGVIVRDADAQMYCRSRP